MRFHFIRQILVGISIFALLVVGEGSMTANAQQGTGARPHFPWPHSSATQSVTARFTPPQGFSRKPAKDRTFGRWLRTLPVKPGNPKVKLFNGKLKKNQSAHVAVLDIDVGTRDLQQCADAVMRLWAEYLLSIGREDRICFRTAGGYKAAWSKWQDGYRPVPGNVKSWELVAKPKSGYKPFQKYLTKVFGIANSASLIRQMAPVQDKQDIQIGDVFIEGANKRGYGHAVIVLDVAVNASGKKVFLLAQSYMPAQEIHILKNPANPNSPWYEPTPDGTLITPEWRFGRKALHRFRKSGC